MSSGRLRRTRRSRRAGGSLRGNARLRLRRAVAAGSSGVLVASLTSACFAQPSVLPTVRDFLIAWQVGNYRAAAGHTTGDRAAVAEALEAVPEQLDAVSLKLAMGPITKQGDQADARFSMRIDLGENGDPWTYTGQMHLRRINGTWKIDWNPSVVNPKLKSGYRLAIVTETPKRQDIQDSSGRSLLRPVRVEIFGVYPQQFSDDAGLKRTMKALATATKLDADQLAGRVRSAPPKQFLPLVTLQQPDHSALTAELARIPGLAHQSATSTIAPDLAPELIGTLGPATAERLQQVGAPYQPGDTIGASGLQLLYQRRLAGIPTVRAVVVDSQGTTEVLKEWLGQPSEPVRTTLNRRVQLRAQQALSGLKMPASIVAVQPPTGQVLAVADHLTAGREIGLAGRYPPGMAFSIVSAEALLNNGLTNGSRTQCPPTTTVGGQTITNHGPGHGPGTLLTSFITNCSTAFAQLSQSLTVPALQREAERFGLGRDWNLPVETFSGSVPPPANDGEKALEMVGEGRVLMSPLALALIAGASASGTWRPPQLFTVPSTPQPIQPQYMEPASIQQLGVLLRRSVTQGTAKKVGVDRTFGTSSQVTYTEGGAQKTLSWFVGYWGNVAFAIMVQGKVDASTIASRFLTGKAK